MFNMSCLSVLILVFLGTAITACEVSEQHNIYEDQIKFMKKPDKQNHKIMSYT